jgi:uncharacterized protein YjdB
VEGITLTGRGTAINAGAAINLAVGDSMAISAAVNPAGVDQTVSWVSGNPAVAAVSNGTISALGAGDAVITVSSAIDPGKTIAFTVHVAGAAVPVTGITLDQSALTLSLGGTDAALAVSYAPANTTQTGVTWSSSDAAVATVTNGVVHAAGAGTAVITAASTVNKAVTASVTVNVAVPVTGIALDKTALSLNKDETGALTVTYTPANTTQTGVTWSSNSPAVATVSNNGTVTAVAEGTALITAASAADSRVFATCTVNVVTVVVPVTGITLNKTALSLNKDGTDTLRVTYTPAATTQTGLIWSSSNTNVATVSDDGTVTAVAEGTADITAASTADSKVFAACTVNVVSIVIPVTGIALDKAALSLNKGETGALTAAYTPATTTQQGLTWSSSNPAVATVSGNGTVTAVAAGSADITAASTANSSVFAACTVTVTVPLTGISLNPNPLTITGAGTTGSFTVTYVPADTTQTGVSWSSSNPAVATVSGGRVTAVAGGTAFITATSTANSTVTANATVNVVIPLTGITLNQTSLSLSKGGTGALTVAYTPTTTTQTGVTWSSSDPAVATVSDGAVTAVGSGTATITATSTANNAISASAAVNVTAFLAGIRLSPDTLNVGTERTGALTVVYDPPDTTQKGVSWSSSDASVATVTGYAGGGKVTGVGAGTATITVTSTADGSKTASARVNVFVTVPITGLGLDTVSLNLNKGDFHALTPVFTPTDTTDTDIIWSSSNPAVATVDSATGVITAVGGGPAVITATSAADDTVTVNCTITVTVPLKGISLNPDPLTITGLGNTGSFAVIYDPEDTTQRGVTWSSDDDDVATVDPDTGKITAVAAGTATITATSADDNTVTADCAVTVTVPLTGISLTPDPLTITGAETTGSFTVTYIPADTTQQGVTWSSSNAAVAKVDSGTGVITAEGGGTAVITATSKANNTVTASAVVNVVIPVISITLDKSALTLTEGRTGALTVTYNPADTTQRGVTWSSDDDDVATVDPDTGEITAKADGSATITATSKENSGISASCALTVQETFNGAEVSIEFKGLEDETITLNTTVAPWGDLVVTAPAGFNRYLWYRDGGFSASTTIPTWTSYPAGPGLHYITVIVEEDGYHFSKTLIYTVGY